MLETRRWRRNCGVSLEQAENLERGKQVKEYLLNVVKQTSTLLDSGNNRGKVVVSQNHVGCLLGDIAAVETHGNAHVRLLQGGRVVHAVSGHDAKRLPP